MKDVLNAADSVNQIGTPQSVPSQLLGTQQSVISQENFEMHGPHVD
ncbi:hypothetical protein CIPAW_08G118800 [Carya illinoinensis]|uniref:Uncharacterized protein n=1 Tax=Carya illinoinensis TaxID=32201 RepID=A0A8T1PWY8_CARIL|nr:hypothetical protein CIPAW_08G118800 [Carya illinoinensis]